MELDLRAVHVQGQRLGERGPDGAAAARRREAADADAGDANAGRDRVGAGVRERGPCDDPQSPASPRGRGGQLSDPCSRRFSVPSARSAIRDRPRRRANKRSRPGKAGGAVTVVRVTDRPRQRGVCVGDTGVPPHPSRTRARPPLPPRARRACSRARGPLPRGVRSRAADPRHGANSRSQTRLRPWPARRAGRCPLARPERDRGRLPPGARPSPREGTPASSTPGTRTRASGSSLAVMALITVVLALTALREIQTSFGSSSSRQSSPNPAVARTLRLELFALESSAARSSPPAITPRAAMRAIHRPMPRLSAGSDGVRDRDHSGSARTRSRPRRARARRGSRGSTTAGRSRTLAARRARLWRAR